MAIKYVLLNEESYELTLIKLSENEYELNAKLVDEDLETHVNGLTIEFDLICDATEDQLLVIVRNVYKEYLDCIIDKDNALIEVYCEEHI